MDFDIARSAVPTSDYFRYGSERYSHGAARVLSPSHTVLVLQTFPERTDKVVRGRGGTEGERRGGETWVGLDGTRSRMGHWGMRRRRLVGWYNGIRSRGHQGPGGQRVLTSQRIDATGVSGPARQYVTETNVIEKCPPALATGHCIAVRWHVARLLTWWVNP